MKNILNIVVLTMLVYSTIQAQTQCFDPDPGIWKDTWTSCQKTDNPNSVYPKSHWIQYDFGVTRKLSNSWVWNANDPNNLNVGFNVVNVDYSMDGVNWTYWGEMTFPKAKGEAVYSGFQGPKFEGIEARYVLLTAMTNHGDPTCAGLAEVKFNLLPNYELSNFEGEEEEEEEEEYCLFVTDVVIDEVTATTASIYWDYEFYGEEEPFFFFQIRGGDDEEGYEIELEESYVFLDDLAEDTRYEFRIETECDEEIVFTEVFEFTTKSGDLTTSIDNKISDRGRGIINLYPNPTKRLFNMVYNSKEGDYLDVQVQNNLGQVVYRNAYPLIQGDTNIRVQVPSVPDGIYYVRTTSMKAREQHYRKLMISSE